LERTTKTELGVRKTNFTVNGESVFLLGISFYGALGEPECFVTEDLDDMKRYGFNWFRVWATWAAFENDVSCVDGQGNPREPYLGKLKQLVKEANDRGLIVDVTISRWNGAAGSPRLKSIEALSRAASTILEALKTYRNWYLDTANEHNITDHRYVSFKELKEIRELVKGLDPRRLVTSSHAGDVREEELRQYLLTVRVDFVAPHRPRRASTADETQGKTIQYFNQMRTIGRVVPVHYQEPFRRGFNPERWEPKAEDFLHDLEEARQGGAAGWCMHNGDQRDKPDRKPRRSFDLREKRLFCQLDNEEMEVIDLLSAVKE